MSRSRKMLMVTVLLGATVSGPTRVHALKLMQDTITYGIPDQDNDDSSRLGRHLGIGSSQPLGRSHRGEHTATEQIHTAEPVFTDNRFEALKTALRALLLARLLP